MNNYVRQKLCEIIKIKGPSVYNEEKKIEGLLKDYCGEHKKEINIIIIAIKSGIVSEIISSKDNKHIELLIPNFIKTMIEEYSLNENAAKWVIETICISLNIIDKVESKDKIIEHLKTDKTIKSNSVKNILKKTLLIKNGEELKLENSIFEIMSSIIVEYGGKLLVNNATLKFSANSGIISYGSLIANNSVFEAQKKKEKWTNEPVR